jgi:hypothetical protein
VNQVLGAQVQVDDGERAFERRALLIGGEEQYAQPAVPVSAGDAQRILCVAGPGGVAPRAAGPAVEGPGARLVCGQQAAVRQSADSSRLARAHAGIDVDGKAAERLHDFLRALKNEVLLKEQTNGNELN